MTLDSLILLAGALVALVPFLGFKNSWDTVIFFVLGVFIIALGIIVRRRTPRRSERMRDAHYVENQPGDNGRHVNTSDMESD